MADVPEEKKISPTTEITPAAVEEPKPKPVQKASAPLQKNSAPSASKYSIESRLRTETEISDKKVTSPTEDLPANHFSETDLQDNWLKFLQEIISEDPVIGNAIAGFVLEKEDENLIKLKFPSYSAKAEFEKVACRFLNAFKHHVNNFKVEFNYVFDGKNLKREIETKRTIFEKFVKLNPLLKDLDDLFKLDLNS